MSALPLCLDRNETVIPNCHSLARGPVNGIGSFTLWWRHQSVKFFFYFPSLILNQWRSSILRAKIRIDLWMSEEGYGFVLDTIRMFHPSSIQNRVTFAGGIKTKMSNIVLTQHRRGYFSTPFRIGGIRPPAITRTNGRSEAHEAAIERSQQSL